jgi:hypothetical protein
MSSLQVLFILVPYDMCQMQCVIVVCVCLRLGSLPFVINGLSGVCVKNLH